MTSRSAVHVAQLSLHDFRSYVELDLALTPGVTAFVGRNGQGKTNIVEAVDYLSRLASHRVATDAPLVRHGASRAVVRAAVVKEGREALLEVEINPGRSNRARVNRAVLPRARDLVGLVRTVVFAPDDLSLVKGDPAERRRFLDDLLVLRTPRLAGVRADYERVLRQRNALLKSAVGADRSRRRPPRTATPPPEWPEGAGLESTLAVWDDQLVRLGAELVVARRGLVDALAPLVDAAYAAVARTEPGGATITYAASVPGGDGDRGDLEKAFAAALEGRHREELARGVSLVGPHRDELELAIGALPVRGYASHGESWSFALALRIASYELLRAEGDDPILVLDDVFAELDADRRDRLAALVAGAEQVLVTAAVGADVPDLLVGTRREVSAGRVA